MLCDQCLLPAVLDKTELLSQLSFLQMGGQKELQTLPCWAEQGLSVLPRPGKHRAFLLLALSSQLQLQDSL